MAKVYNAQTDQYEDITNEKALALLTFGQSLQEPKSDYERLVVRQVDNKVMRGKQLTYSYSTVSVLRSLDNGGREWLLRRTEMSQGAATNLAMDLYNLMRSLGFDVTQEREDWDESKGKPE